MKTKSFLKKDFPMSVLFLVSLFYVVPAKAQLSISPERLNQIELLEVDQNKLDLFNRTLSTVFTGSIFFINSNEAPSSCDNVVVQLYSTEIDYPSGAVFPHESASLATTKRAEGNIEGNLTCTFSISFKEPLKSTSKSVYYTLKAYTDAVPYFSSDFIRVYNLKGINYVNLPMTLPPSPR